MEQSLGVRVPSLALQRRKQTDRADYRLPSPNQGELARMMLKRRELRIAAVESPRFIYRLKSAFGRVQFTNYRDKDFT